MEEKEERINIVLVLNLYLLEHSWQKFLAAAAKAYTGTYRQT
jgi:hypothetical protein